MTELKIIAHIRTDFKTKFGLPRQSGVVPELCGVIEFTDEYKNTDALRGLEGYSHLWLIWGFSEGFVSRSDDRSAKWNPTVRPPRLGGNMRMGVFATRSPNRPNPIGLSVVKLEKIDGTDLYVSGIDMVDNTPIYDIKPYLPHIDAIPDALGGFAVEENGDRLNVEFPDELLALIPESKRNALIECLRGDPRPSYQAARTDGREYGFPYAGFDVKFVVHGTALTVTDIK